MQLLRRIGHGMATGAEFGGGDGGLAAEYHRHHDDPQYGTCEQGAARAAFPPSVLRAFLAHFGLGLEVVMVLELRITGEGAVQFVVLVHGLGVLDVLVKVEGVFLVHRGGEGGVGLLGALPRAAFVVQVAGVAAFFKAEVLSGIRQGLARCGLLRFLVGRARPCGGCRDTWSRDHGRIRSLRRW